MNYWIYFITGLTTGGVSCLAMQAGLLTSMIVNQENLQETKQQSKDKSVELPLTKIWQPVALFLTSKLVVHTMFGALLGALGSVIALSGGVRLFFQALAALFLFATAMNLLNVHPIFRYVIFQPPRFVRKLLKNNQRSQSAFAPLVLGALTVLIPCPVTQAMEIAAVGSGSAVAGALIMLSFVLGTSPLFGFVGVLATKLTQHWQDRFMRFAAYLLIFMAIMTLNGVLVVLDFPVTLQKVTAPITDYLAGGPYQSSVTNTNRAATGVQKVQLFIASNGYSPKYLSVYAGQPVELTISANKVYSCAADFVFKQFDIRHTFEANETQVYTFTPMHKGKFTFTCSMGMYTGTMEVL